jgi:hypothetical protein
MMGTIEWSLPDKILNTSMIRSSMEVLRAHFNCNGGTFSDRPTEKNLLR